MKAVSIRVRLTLWYMGVLAALLVMYSGGVYLFLRQRAIADLDKELHEQFEAAEPMLVQTSDGGVTWRGEMDEDESNLWLEVHARDGRLLWTPPDSHRESISPPVGGQRWERSGPESIELADGMMVRRMSRLFSVGQTPVVITAACSEEPARHTLGQLLFVMLLSVPVSAGLAGFGGWFLARRALGPVERITERAKAITAERLSERLPVANAHDELGRLASTFNDMFARLDRSFERLRRFTADASHELRTPLTAIKSVGEVGLREHRDEHAYREIVGSMLEEVDRLVRLVNGLLQLSRADAGQLVLAREPMDLADLTREVAEELGVLAEEKHQAVSIVADGAATASIDRVVLRQALVNLLDNAIRHSPEHARIGLTTKCGDSGVTVEISDNGPGIAPDLHARIFDRFFRVDVARSRDHGGAGLGLSIARCAVEAHGGRIELDSELGKGSTFRIVLHREAQARQGRSDG